MKKILKKRLKKKRKWALISRIFVERNFSLLYKSKRRRRVVLWIRKKKGKKKVVRNGRITQAKKVIQKRKVL